jgi:hydrogenase maturation protease
MNLLIGYGNTLRGDDGIGPVVARRLAARIDREDVAIMALHQLTPELVEPISRARAVVFVDACHAESPGLVRCVPVSLPTDGDPGARAGGAFTHNVTPAALLAGAKMLYGAAPCAVLVTVSGGSFDFGESFSPPVAGVVPRLLDKLQRALESGSAISALLGIADV